MDESKQISAAARVLANAGHAVCFTGAGISAESGIPTFRGTGGIWQQYPPAFYGNIPGLALAFVFRPSRVRSFAADAVELMVVADPNAGHLAIAEMEKDGLIQAVITQNIDGLHEIAGSSNVLNMHGSLYVFRCRSCGAKTDVSREWLREVPVRLRSARASRIALFRAFKSLTSKCPRCGGTQRPDIVFFGESLPERVLTDAFTHAAQCDAMLVVGTSGLVYPAANVPIIAAQKGAAIIEVNPSPSPISDIAAIRLSGSSSEMLPRLRRKLATLV